MARNDHSPRSDHGWIVDVLLNVFGDLDGVCGLVRLIGHGLFLIVRAALHLFTCHF